jgi:two-component system cell cycle response regulator
MAHSQYRTPLAAKIAAGLTLLALGLLFAHNALGLGWPGILPTGWGNWVYYGVEWAGTALCLGRVLTRRSERGAWIAIAIGLALFSGGDLYWALVFGVNANSVPVPSVADGFYLSAYPAWYVGIGLLLRSRVGRLPAGLWLDGLIAALAVAALGGTVVLGPVLSATHGRPLAVATNLAYPLGDLLLLGLIVGIIALSGWRRAGGWWLIAIGFALFAVVDSIYLVQSAENTYVSNGLLDVGWPAAIAVIALASWRTPARMSAVRLDGLAAFLVPTLAAMTCLALETADHFAAIPLIAHLLAVLCLLLAIGRLALTFAENIRMLRASRTEAVTDALTGLGNRRALELELHARLTEDPVRPFVVAFYDLDGFKGYNDAFGHQAGARAARRAPRRPPPPAATPAHARVFRLGGDEFCVLADGPGGEAAAAVAAQALQERGATFAVGCSYGLVHVPGEAASADAAMLLADTRMYEDKGGRRPSAAAESQGVLLRALAERNRDLGQHNDDVAALAEMVACAVGLEGSLLEAVRRAAELHDVGKLAIPDAILNKTGPLDEDEWTFMRRHTIVGERIVASATSLRDVAPIVRSSHERWDGEGYPDRLAAEAIPLGARIVAVCDAYDAMVTTRPYRQGMSHETALTELRRCAGSQFDPAIVAAFEQVIEAGRQADARAAERPEPLAA